MCEEEDLDSFPITKKVIVETCVKHNLYISPEMNDVLYLHYKGFSKIADLDEYINVKTLWLNNNSLTRINGLSFLTNLSTLYLNDNLIEEIEGLESLERLETLILSFNYIGNIRGLEKCKALTTIALDHNQLKSCKSLEGLTLCPSIEALNVSHNKINDTGDNIIAFLEKMRNIKVLKMDGNIFIREMKNYRRRIINALPELRFLDDNPVNDNDRRLAAAWLVGGREAEIQERYKINAENQSVHKEYMRDFRRMKRDALINSGNKLDGHPELLSSDDEQKPILLKEKYKRLSKEMDDDNNDKKEKQKENVNNEDTTTFYTQSKSFSPSEDTDKEKDDID